MNIVRLLKAHFQRRAVNRSAKALLSYLNDVEALQAHAQRLTDEAATAKGRANSALQEYLITGRERPQQAQAPVSIVLSQDSRRGRWLSSRVLSREETLFVDARLRELSRKGALPRLGWPEADWIRVIFAEILTARELSSSDQDASTRTIRDGGQA